LTNKEGWIIFITDIKLRQRQRIQVMIETVVSLGLPAGERLLVKKNVLKPMVITGSEKRVCIVTGTHGDELEGQFVCYELNRRIEEHLEYLKGIVEIYPALNPLGVNSITRGVPGFDLDMNWRGSLSVMN
jgi:predicted deacylase